MAAKKDQAAANLFQADLFMAIYGKTEIEADAMIAQRRRLAIEHGRLATIKALIESADAARQAAALRKPMHLDEHGFLRYCSLGMWSYNPPVPQTAPQDFPFIRCLLPAHRQ
jgi:hypothetical protein